MLIYDKHNLIAHSISYLLIYLIHCLSWSQTSHHKQIYGILLKFLNSIYFNKFLHLYDICIKYMERDVQNKFCLVYLFIYLFIYLFLFLINKMNLYYSDDRAHARCIGCCYSIYEGKRTVQKKTLWISGMYVLLIIVLKYFFKWVFSSWLYSIKSLKCLRADLLESLRTGI